MTEAPSSKKYTKEVLGWVFGLGYRIALPLILFALLGRLLDKKFETGALFLLGGIALALAASAFSVYRQLRPLLEKKDIQDTEI